MKISNENLKVIGKCYFLCLTLNLLILLVFAFVCFLLYKEIENPEYQSIFRFIKNNEAKLYLISIVFLWYFSFCLILNALAGFFLLYNIGKELQIALIIANFFSLPFGSIISAFSLYFLYKLNKVHKNNLN